MPRKKDDFSVSLVMDVDPDEGDRYHASATLEIEDAGKPFFRCRVDYYDMPDEGLDFLAHLFEMVAEQPLPFFVEQASERMMLDVEKRAVTALSQLTVLGDATESKTRDEKAAYNKQLVEAMGIRGKADKHKKHKDKK